MELAFELQKLNCLELRMYRTAVQEQNQEVLIPDDAPDISEIVYCSAELELRSKELRANGIQISGVFRTNCLYSAEAEKAIQTVSSQIPFSCYLEQSAVDGNLQLMINGGVRSAEATRSHNRKIQICIGYFFQIYGYCPVEKSVCVPENPPKCLQTKTERYTVKIPSESADRPFHVEEELTISSGTQKMEQIVSYSLLPQITEQNLVGNKIVWKGNLQFRILYLTPEGQLETAIETIQISQYCPLNQEYESQPMQILLQQMQSQIEIVPSLDETKLLFSGSFLAQYLVYRDVEIVTCLDAYSTTGTLHCEWASLSLDVLLDQVKKDLLLRASRQTETQMVIAADLYPDCPVITRTETTVQIELPVRAQILLMDRDGRLRELVLQETLQQELPLSSNGTLIASVSVLPDGYTSASALGVELRYELALQMDAIAQQSFRLLCEGTIEAQDTAGRPSIVVYMDAGDASLWDLAKKYATTVDAIQKANNTELPRSSDRRTLLIPTVS